MTRDAGPWRGIPLDLWLARFSLPVEPDLHRSSWRDVRHAGARPAVVGPASVRARSAW